MTSKGMTEMFVQVTTDGPHKAKGLSVRSLHDASDMCRRLGLEGNIYDEDEIIATVSNVGVLRDLDQQIIEITV